jgi:hypothetical protein
LITGFLSNEEPFLLHIDPCRHGSAPRALDHENEAVGILVIPLQTGILPALTSG